MRALRWLAVLAVLAVLAALAVSELIARPLAQRAIGTDLRKRYGLDATPSVSLGGFPFLYHVARGRLPDASGHLRQVTIQGLRIDNATIRLTDIRFDAAQLASGGREVTARQGVAEATVSDAAVSDYLARQQLDLLVRFAPGRVSATGRVDLQGNSIVLTGSGALTLAGDELRFRPDAVTAAGLQLAPEVLDPYRDGLGFTVPIPDVAGVHLTRLSVGDHQVTLGADVTDYLLAR